MNIATADLWDDHMNDLSLLNLDLINYGAKTSFGGQLVTLKLFEDNTYIRKTLSENGEGKVLFVDGGGSKRCALLGDNIAGLAIENGWEGIIIYGCIRDSKVVKGMEIGIKAIGTCPVKSSKRNVGLRSETLLINGSKVVDGDYVYSDEDGVLLSHKKLL